ncbi:MAG: DUF2490 domain-containing protein [Bacteroidota bacterium]
MKKTLLLLTVLTLCSTYSASAQEIDEGQLGAWYMYFVNKKFNNSKFGIQGDYQFRYWNAGSDLEQILLRTGATYKADDHLLLTLGYASITSGTFGESTNTSHENRVYQEALLSQRVGSRFLLTHRFRYEQRWVANQDTRTRFRYNLFLNVPFNKESLERGAVYLALYNEIFINGQRDIGDDRQVEVFDRNRTYVGLGYSLAANLRVQGGWMKQTTDNWSKGQAQISLHHRL